jgi:hypothetical protein
MKRYSIFISSPSSDTREEREVVISALLTGAYIPAGMEFFYSAAKETKSHIREMIDYSDYVCIILKSAYGAPPPDIGISWTEYEYGLARHELGKPIVAFVYNGDTQARDPRTMALIERIEREGTSVRFWRTTAELGGAVIGSIQNLVRERPAPGWVRTDKYHDEQESLQSFYRRSADYDFTDFILHEGDIRVLLNDGYNWRRRHELALTRRFEKLRDFSTTIVTLDETSNLLEHVAAKSEKSLSHQQNDIREFHAALTALARAAGYDKLRLLRHGAINTHCLYICSDYAIVTSYFTSPHRFQHLPLFKYRGGTDIYDDFLMDFETIARVALDRLRG